MNAPLRSKRQSGVLLIEVLVALLIFALGVLGLVSLQASAIKQSSQSKYRADATLIANELIGQMWMSDRTPATLDANFSSAKNGAAYLTWKSKVNATLPGAGTYPPSVVVTGIQQLPALVAGAQIPSGIVSSSRVTITMYWKAPGEPAGEPPHNVVLINEIR